MSDIAAIKAAAVKVLSEATGLRATSYIPESISPPAAFVHVTAMQPDTFGLESMGISLDFVVLVARSRPGDELLSAYQSDTGPQSVWAALNQNNLGLTGVRVTLGEYRALGVEEIAAYGYIGGAFSAIVST